MWRVMHTGTQATTLQQTVGTQVEGVDPAVKLAKKRKRALTRKQLKMLRMRLAQSMLELRDVKEEMTTLGGAVGRLQVRCGCEPYRVEVGWGGQGSLSGLLMRS